MDLGFLNYVYWGVITVVSLGCLIASGIMLSRTRSRPAILATVAFGLFFLQSLGWILRIAWLDGFIRNRLMGDQTFGPWAINACCCGLLQVIGFVCLIVAIWQALADRAESV